MNIPLTFAPGHHKSCGCADCLKVRRRYGKLHAIDVHRNGPRWALAAPAAVKLREFTDQGWSLAHIAHLSGVDHASCLRVLRGLQIRVGREGLARILGCRPHASNAPADRTPVPAVGMRRRMYALYRMGWTSASIAEAGGAPEMQLRRILVHDTGTCTARTWMVVERAYSQLAMRTGPSSKTRKRAIASGYAPPLAWDDETIDDPAATPHISTEQYGTAVDDIEWLIDCGGTWESIPGRLGITKEGVDRSLRRANRLDLIARLTPARAS